MAPMDWTSKRYGEFALYEITEGRVYIEAFVERETVWLNEYQLSLLFDRKPFVIARHMKNIYQVRELERNATCAIFAPVQMSNEDRLTSPAEYYNLDLVLALSFRLKTSEGIGFLTWANRVMGAFAEGLNASGQDSDAEQAAAGEASPESRSPSPATSRELTADDYARATSELTKVYRSTWRILAEFDGDSLPVKPGEVPDEERFNGELAIRVLDQFKRDLMYRGQATELFGASPDDKLEAVLGNIQQTMFSEPLYKSVEERAAHLLYFIIKDHPFVDGNKRIASLLFLLYLLVAGMPYRLSPEALAALALLLAESDPADKDRMIRLTVNLLGKRRG